MNARALLLIGAIAGVIIGNTSQGRRAYKEAGRRVAELWRDPRVQSRVDDVEKGVRDIPVVGDDVAGFIKSKRPAATETAAASTDSDS
ncbi:hypothetical protein BH11ACT3_BH11ACT3_23550 [soil metagenome]